MRICETNGKLDVDPRWDDYASGLGSRSQSRPESARFLLKMESESYL